MGACANPMRSCGAATTNPECTLSNTEAIVACNAPPASVVTFPEGGTGFSGSVPNVIVCGVIGSSFVHSAVSPKCHCAGMASGKHSTNSNNAHFTPRFGHTS